MNRPSRRHVLRGAGVALTLPFFESLAPRPARAQTPPRRRFVAFYFPLGIVTPGYWTPAASGTGNAWSLSPLLAPLAPVKNRVTVLGQVDQTVYGPNGIEPHLGPNDTPVGQVYQYTLESDHHTPSELRGWQDWVVSKHLMRTPGEGERLIASYTREGFGKAMRGGSDGMSDDALDEYWKGFDGDARRQFLR